MLPIADMRQVVAAIDDRSCHFGDGCTLSKQTARPAAVASVMGQNRTLRSAQFLSGCVGGSVPAWPLSSRLKFFLLEAFGAGDVRGRSSIGTEHPVPKEMDHREIAVRVPVMNEVQLLFPSEPCKPLKSRSLHVVFLVEKDVRVERRRTSNYLNHEEIEWQ
jgi:hypothetical protein